MKMVEDYMRRIGALMQPDVPELDCGSFFMVPAEGIGVGSAEEHSNKEFIVTMVKMLLNRRCVYRWHKTEGSRLLFFTDGMGYALGHKKAFDAVSALPQRRDLLLPEVRGGRLASPAKVLGRCRAALRWAKRRKEAGLTQKELLYCMPFLLAAWDFYREFCGCDFTPYRLVTVYFDLAPTAAVLVALCKAQGVCTAGLQHGMYQPTPRARHAHGSNYYHLTRADLFLAWNRLAAQQAEEDGLAAQRIRVLGILRFDAPPACGAAGSVSLNTGESGKVKGAFGVVFSIHEQEDTAMLRVANALAAETGLRYYTRYHPNQQQTEYDTFIDKKYWLGNLAGADYTLAAYAQKVDFTLLGSSSTFAELIRLHSRAYHFSAPEQEKNCYSDVAIGAFSTAAEVLCYEQAPEKTERELFELLCSVEDSAASYKAFFESMEHA